MLFSGALSQLTEVLRPGNYLKSSSNKLMEILTGLDGSYVDLLIVGPLASLSTSLSNSSLIYKMWIICYQLQSVTERIK